MKKNNYSVTINNKTVEVANIYAVGRNYSDHAKEMKSEISKDPIFFQKSLTSLSKSSTIVLPEDREIHHELEVVILLGKSGEKIREENAMDYIEGFGLGLDLTDRKLQSELKKDSLPWFISKSFKGSAVVSEFYKWDDINLKNDFWLKKNDATQQISNINKMIFSMNKLISYLSNSFPLLKGDLIYTGTPSGVGPIYNGDLLEIGIGKQSFMNIDVVDSKSVNNKTSTYSLYVDGAADLHTKTAGIGGVFYNDQNEEIYTFSEYLDDATNNEAEYSALIKGIECGLDMNLININIFSDSELIVKQVNGDYKVKNDRMKKLHHKVINLLKGYNTWTIQHVMRDKNVIADKLSKDGRNKRS